MSTPPSFDLVNLFPTPLLVGGLAEAATIGPALEAAIVAKRAIDPGARKSNRDGWHSSDELQDWGGSAVVEVIQAAVARVNAVTRAVDGSPPRWRVASWANMLGAGGSNVAHVHPGAVWSAVYYVRVDPGDGGNLCFYDPRGAAPEMVAGDLSIDVPGATGAVEFPPRAGMLIVFPSWLRHAVQRYDGPGLRISIAMNLTLA